MTKKYYEKAKMLEGIKKEDSKPEMYIFFKDKDKKNKFTYIDTHKKLLTNLNLFVVDNRYYINELVLNNQKRKPYLDIEKIYYNEEEYEQNYKKIIKKLQKDIINVFKKEYNENITIDDILLLNSSGNYDNKYKFSIHVIISPKDKTLYYTDSKYSKSAAYHLYTSLINIDSNYKDILDPQVYKSEFNFRIIESYKDYNDDRNLKPIDVRTFENIKISINEKLEYFLTYIKSESKQLNTPLIEQTTKVKNTIIKNKPSITNIDKHLLNCVKKYHPTAFFNKKYNDMYYNFSYTNRKELCPISGLIHKGSNGFYVFETERGYYMKCFSASCKGSIHIGYAEDMDDIIENAYQINQQYLITDGEINTEPEELVKNLIKNWLKDDIKTLAIKSPMGTGKTTMIHKLLKYDTSLKKILWITHRQTLTKQIFGSFKKHKFISYMDIQGCLFDYDRIIVQIDSIMRISKYDTNNNIIFKQYDLVIIDEIESNLNHYTSPFIQKPDNSARDKFRFMMECIDSARKLLALDADIAIRTKLFIDNFGKYIIVNNNYKPNKKIFTITNNYILFNKEMLTDLNEKKNICIISMSASALEKIETKLKSGKINYVMHTSKTDDKLKNELENVNDFWINYQCVLYSPTIESGVDFNKDHFDKIFCILKSGQNTCSQRAFLQMVGRIRRVKDSNILCYYDGPTKLSSLMYTYDDVLNYFRYYEELNGKKILQDVEYKKEVVEGEVMMKRIKTNISLFDHISIYNEVEQLNKHSQIFITVLNKLIQRAGYELKLNLDKKTIKSSVKIPIENILADINEKKYNVNILIEKQSKNKLDSHEKLVLKKIFFMKTFGLTNSKNKKSFINFYKKYNGKENIVKRYEKIFGYKMIYDEQDIDNFNDGKDKSRHIIIFDIINRLINKNKKKYTSDELIDIVIPHDQYIQAINDITKNSIYFKNEDKNRALFFKSKNINTKKNNIYYMKTIQSILILYGINFKIHKRIRINNKLQYEYCLSVDEQIKNIIDFKYKINIDEIVSFK